MTSELAVVGHKHLKHGNELGLEAEEEAEEPG